MNSITHTINGLASSLLLNVGLTNIAQKLDPVSAKPSIPAAHGLSTEFSDFPTHFTPKKGM
jgi:hypothetical protein